MLPDVTPLRQLAKCWRQFVSVICRWWIVVDKDVDVVFEEDFDEIFDGAFDFIFPSNFCHLSQWMLVFHFVKNRSLISLNWLSQINNTVYVKKNSQSGLITWKGRSANNRNVNYILKIDVKCLVKLEWINCMYRKNNYQDFLCSKFFKTSSTVDLFELKVNSWKIRHCFRARITLLLKAYSQWENKYNE